MTSSNDKGLLKALFLYLSLSFLLSSCAGMPPLVEQAKAVEAQKFAKKNYALKYAAPLYRRGVLYLKDGHKKFEKRVYEKARKSYDIARRYFEKSETKARITQIKKGGEF
jgi:hypothetical protein